MFSALLVLILLSGQMRLDYRSPRYLGLSTTGLAYIAETTGYHPRPYNSGEDDYSIWLYDRAYHARGDCLIGYGHYLHPYACHPRESFLFITEETAYMLLRYDLTLSQFVVRELVTAPVTQSQFDALVALVFDCGRLCLENSPLLDAINNQDHRGVKRWWAKTGIVSAGESIPVWEEKRYNQLSRFMSDYRWNANPSAIR